MFVVLKIILYSTRNRRSRGTCRHCWGNNCRYENSSTTISVPIRIKRYECFTDISVFHSKFWILSQKFDRTNREWYWLMTNGEMSFDWSVSRASFHRYFEFQNIFDFEPKLFQNWDWLVFHKSNFAGCRCPIVFKTGATKIFPVDKFVRFERLEALFRNLIVRSDAWLEIYLYNVFLFKLINIIVKFGRAKAAN